MPALLHSRLCSIDSGNRATVTLKFSDTSKPCETSDSKLRAIAGEAMEKIGEKSAIVEKLEKIRGLTGVIEAVGEVVKEVSSTHHTYCRLCAPHPIFT